MTRSARTIISMAEFSDYRTVDKVFRALWALLGYPAHFRLHAASRYGHPGTANGVSITIVTTDKETP